MKKITETEVRKMARKMLKEEYSYKLSHLKNKDVFTKDDLNQILEALYFEVDPIGQQRILDMQRFFGLETE